MHLKKINIVGRMEDVLPTPVIKTWYIPKHPLPPEEQNLIKEKLDVSREKE